MRESEFSHRAAEESLPLRDAFSVLFFVSVGMLFEPQVLVDAAAEGAGRGRHHHDRQDGGRHRAGARFPLSTQHSADGVGASLAQIGEFSFILAGLGVALGLLPTQGQSLILAGALISIALNSLVFAAIAPVQHWLRARSGLARNLERSVDPLAELPTTVDQSRLTGQIVLVGYGRVGRRIARMLDAQGNLVRRRRTEPRIGGAASRTQYSGGFRRCVRARGPGPGAHRARRHAGDRDAGYVQCPQDGRDCQEAQSRIET